jgi:HEAT repeat protein
MKRRFFIKLAVAIAAGFVLLLAGFFLFKPAWFLPQERRALTNAPKTADSASPVELNEEPTMPNIRKWLKSKDERIFVRACKILENMAGEEWQDAVPELENMLSEIDTTRSNAAAEVVLKHVPLSYQKRKINWNKYITNPDAKLGMLIFQLKSGETRRDRWAAAIILGEIGDRRAVPALVSALDNDPDYGVKDYIATSLGKLRDNRASKSLIKYLYAKDPPAQGPLNYNFICCNRQTIIKALQNIGDSYTVDLLLMELDNSPEPVVRINAVESLVGIPDNRCLSVIIKTLKKDKNDAVKANAAFALLSIGDNQAVDTLIKEIYHDSQPITGRCYMAFALAAIGNESAVQPLSVLAELAEDNNIYNSVSISLYWLTGELNPIKPIICRPYLEMYSDNSTIMKYLDFAKARWGDTEVLLEVINKLTWDDLKRFHADIMSRMPEGFPKYDFKADEETRKKQESAIRCWYIENVSRLAWDAEKRKYYLKTADK